MEKTGRLGARWPGVFSVKTIKRLFQNEVAFED